MARLLPVPSSFCRIGSHAVALIAVVGLAFVSAAATRPPVIELQVAAVDDPGSSQPLPAQVPLPLGPINVVPTVAPRTQGADQRQVVTFNPRLGLPQWLRTIQDTPLWSGSDATATPVGSLPAGNIYVKPLGQFVDSRVQVYFPGDDARPAAQAWVDASTVE